MTLITANALLKRVNRKYRNETGEVFRVRHGGFYLLDLSRNTVMCERLTWTDVLDAAKEFGCLKPGEEVAP